MLSSSSSAIVNWRTRHGLAWTQLILALSFLLGFLTGNGRFFKQYFGKLKIWIKVMISGGYPRALYFQKKQAKEAAVAARTASTAVAEVARASHEMIKVHNEDKKAASLMLHALEAHILELTKVLISMKLLMAASNKVRHPVPSEVEAYESQDASKSWKSTQASQKVSPTAISNDAFINNGNLAVKPLSVNATDSALHSSSYMKIMEMLERGETPPGIMEINDKPPNPNQPPSVSRLQPKPKPWETRTSISETVASIVHTKDSIQSKLLQDDSHSEQICSSDGLDVDFMPRQEKGRGELETRSSPVLPGEIKQMETRTFAETFNNKDNLTTSRQIFGASRKVWTPPPIPETSMPGAAAAIKSWKGMTPQSAQLSMGSNLQSEQFTEQRNMAMANKTEVLNSDQGKLECCTVVKNGGDDPNHLQNQDVQEDKITSDCMHKLIGESLSKGGSKELVGKTTSVTHDNIQEVVEQKQVQYNLTPSDTSLNSVQTYAEDISHSFAGHLEQMHSNSARGVKDQVLQQSTKLSAENNLQSELAIEQMDTTLTKKANLLVSDQRGLEQLAFMDNGGEDANDAQSQDVQVNKTMHELVSGSLSSGGSNELVGNLELLMHDNIQGMVDQGQDEYNITCCDTSMNTVKRHADDISHNFSGKIYSNFTREGNEKILISQVEGKEPNNYIDWIVGKQANSAGELNAAVAEEKISGDRDLKLQNVQHHSLCANGHMSNVKMNVNSISQSFPGHLEKMCSSSTKEGDDLSVILQAGPNGSSDLGNQIAEPEGKSGALVANGAIKQL